MTNDDLDRMIGELAGSYNEPPAPPREVMWASIEAARRRTNVLPLRLHRRTTRWLAGAAGIAAVLMVGIALGRVSRGPASDGQVSTTHAPMQAPVVAGPSIGHPEPLPPATEPSVALGAARRLSTLRFRPGTSGAARSGVDASGDQSAYRLAVVEHLTRTELLLTNFQSEARTSSAKVDAQFAVLARDLLGTTRLMLGTHRNDEPAMTRLLEDLELVLMQVSQYAADGRVIDRDAATQSIDKRNVLTKLRATIPAGT